MRHMNPPKREISSTKLSDELTAVYDEAARLLKLRADWGRMPDGPVKKNILNRIETWFKTPPNSTQVSQKVAKDMVQIRFVMLQELWHADAAMSRDIIRDGCSAEDIQRLETEDWLPDDGRIPF